MVSVCNWSIVILTWEIPVEKKLQFLYISDFEDAKIFSNQIIYTQVVNIVCNFFQLPFAHSEKFLHQKCQISYNSAILNKLC